MILAFLVGLVVGALIWPLWATWHYLSYVRSRRQYFLDNKEALLAIKAERLKRM